MATSLVQELDRLRGLARIGELRAVWPTRFGPTPSHRSPELFRAQLAWRLQVEVHGGLDAETLAVLAKPTSKSIGRRSGPAVGTRLLREWHGERHEVEVTCDGVVHRGATYASLSHAARAITGVRWNGPRFFGLRQDR